ncbi:MAG: serine/threonine protein kinase [Blastocatellia bacterium]|nr:serine/threonine protein kinase [Blastocatellia bacterium]
MERQILAQLEHPNIANLLDGGSTADGLPYLVMEYIEGLPITKFCDSHRFSIEERLEIFRKVCGAVSYAHQNLVVHRDIKPSNILVTSDGTPKLLDFGIAKLLHPNWSVDTEEATATMFRVMTPEYASPEQIRGLPITTASDVYSLGIVLYELLSGQRPYKIESRLPEEVAKVILTEEPIRPRQ